ncbi:hypothetical protein DFH27DRAFT_644853 [Peziza echinospora]|nr:hypothetical protein DFH27DRAFT_644853 [Peziza echinospora]
MSQKMDSTLRRINNGDVETTEGLTIMFVHARKNAKKCIHLAQIALKRCSQMYKISRRGLPETEEEETSSIISEPVVDKDLRGEEVVYDDWLSFDDEQIYRRGLFISLYPTHTPTKGFTEEDAIVTNFTQQPIGLEQEHTNVCNRIPHSYAPQVRPIQKMISRDIQRLEDGVLNVMFLDTFKVKMFETLRRAISARTKLLKYIALAKECQKAMYNILYDINNHDGITYKGTASILFSWFRKRGRSYVNEGEYYLSKCTSLCVEAIIELREEDEEFEEDEDTSPRAMLAKEISNLEEGIEGVVCIDAFDIKMFKTLANAINARNQSKNRLQMAKECEDAMINVLADINQNEGRSFRGTSSIVFSWMRKRGSHLVNEGEQYLRECSAVCAKANQELHEEEDEWE